MSDQFVGEIRIFAGNYAPDGWALCDGQLVSIAQNPALFAVLGTTYGGDGKTSFALPNLIGRAPMHHGQGQGLSDRTQGEQGGTRTVTLTSTQMPVHTHIAYGSGQIGNTNNPQGAVWAQPPVQGKFNKTQTPLYASSGNAPMNYSALPTVGGSQPHNNMQPYLGLTFIIATKGIYPPRG
ncbi:phage tail protein [Brevibacillus fluminis]|uniref:phage tail protein n=1 Tax=Brevibacillus fluminis TaxID=511487 RepID=UPI003F8B9640